MVSSALVGSAPERPGSRGQSAGVGRRSEPYFWDAIEPRAAAPRIGRPGTSQIQGTETDRELRRMDAQMSQLPGLTYLSSRGRTLSRRRVATAPNPLTPLLLLLFAVSRLSATRGLSGRAVSLPAGGPTRHLRFIKLPRRADASATPAATPPHTVWRAAHPVLPAD